MFPSLPLSVYCSMRPGVCAKFQFSPPHQWNGWARARTSGHAHFPDWDVQGWDDGKHNLHFPWQLLQWCHNEEFLRMLRATSKWASGQPRAWCCLRGRNWYFIEFSRQGTWLLAHKTKCWCQFKNRMSLYILLFLSASFYLHIPPQKNFYMKAQ